MPTLHPLVARLLEERGISAVEQFIEPAYEDRPDPFLMKDMDDAVGRILHAIRGGEKIAVWSDYDCDGVPGGALMRDFFEMINYPLRSYIPERREGYGLNRPGLEVLRQEGIALIITVDCGITAVSEVEFAQSLGIDVIITDHHLPGPLLPPAVAVLNPHREDCAYPFKELCGTGVAFKLVEGLLARGGFEVKPGTEKWLLDLVALATIADMVELSGENRTLAWYGFLVMKKGRRTGLAALFKAMRIPLAHVTEDDISFSVAPKINAASRMKSPSLALELLTTHDAVRAEVLAKELVKLNDARKLAGARVAKEVKHRLEGRPVADVIVLGSAEWNPALLGIAATNVVETYKRTVCLWGKDGDLIKGSCRSDGSVNIVSLMSSAHEVFDEFGGHELSGGFAVKAGAIHQLPAVLEETYQRVKFGERVEVRVVPPSISTSLQELSHSLYRALRMLAPFGMGNPKPLFLVERASVVGVSHFGKHQEHARVSLRDDSGTAIDAVAFFVTRAPWYDTVQLLSPGDTVRVHGAFEQSFFGNKQELRLRLEHLELSV